MFALKNFEDDVQNELVYVACAALREWLGERHYLIEGMTTSELRRHVLTIFGVLSPVSNSVEIAENLRQQLLDTIFDYLSNNVDPDQARPRPISQAMINRVAKELKMERIYKLSEQHNGLSSSTVLRVQFEKDSRSQQGYLKLFQDESSMVEELRRHKLFFSSWLHNFAPAMPSQAEEQCALLFEPAVSTNNLDEDLTLHSHLVRNRRAPTLNAVKLLGECYYEEYCRVWRAGDYVERTAAEFCSLLLDQWAEARHAWDTDFFWHECGLPNANNEVLVHSGQMYWNPIHLVGQLSHLESSRFLVVETLQHGDLHTENVLVAEDCSTKFVDFDGVGTLPGMTDLCWLSLNALRSVSPDPNSRELSLNGISACMESIVTGTSRELSVGEFDWAFELIEAIFVRYLEDNGAPRNEYLRIQLELTFAICSLLSSHYQVQRVV